MNDYLYINDMEQLNKSLYVDKDTKVCGIDTETTGLDPRKDKLRLLQIAVENGQTFVIDCFELLPEGLELIQAFLDHFQVKVFQNAKFDINFLRANGIVINSRLFDTMLAGQLLRSSGGPRKVGLGELATHFLGIDLPKDQQTSDFSGQLTEDQLLYAAKDAAILVKLRGVLIQELKVNKLIEVARVEFTCAYAIAHMEYFGIHVNSKKLKELTEIKEAKRGELLEKLYPYIGYPTVQVGLFEEKKESHFNPNSNKQVMEILHKEGIEVDTTSKYALSHYLDHPFVSLLMEYRHVEKELTSFLHSIPDQLDHYTSRVYPHYGQNGAYSGRMSCGNPNIQQVPRGREFRECFDAPEGRALVIADYSQIELRVIAEFSKDQRMISAYQKGEDLHRLTASLVLQKEISQVTKEERQAAKAVNFGLVFGMGAAGLKGYAADTYGAQMSIEEAELFRKRYFQAYRGVNRWQQQIRNQLPSTSRTLAGRKHTYSDDAGLSGRYNTPIQGTAADILKNALGMLHEVIIGTSTSIVAVVHDEIVLECDASRADETAKLLKVTMEKAGERYLKEVPVIAEVAISDSWAGK